MFQRIKCKNWHVWKVILGITLTPLKSSATFVRILRVETSSTPHFTTSLALYSRILSIQRKQTYSGRTHFMWPLLGYYNRTFIVTGSSPLQTIRKQQYSELQKSTKCSTHKLTCTKFCLVTASQTDLYIISVPVLSHENMSESCGVTCGMCKSHYVTLTSSMSYGQGNKSTPFENIYMTITFTTSSVWPSHSPWPRQYTEYSK